MYVPLFISGLLALLFIGFSIGGAKAFGRKSVVALCTSVLAVILMNLMDPVPSADGGLFIGVMVHAAFIVPIIFIYGIIASIVSDKISSKARKHAKGLSCLLHILFGLLFILPYGALIEPLPFTQMTMIEILTNPVTMLGGLVAFTFFAIDSLLKFRSQKSSDRESSAAAS